MESQKEQRQLTDLSNRGLSASEIHEYILNRIGLELEKEYELKEIIEKCILSKVEILSVHNKAFYSDLYDGMKGDVLNSKFQRRAVATLIMDDRKNSEEFLENLDHLEDKEVITETTISWSLSLIPPMKDFTFIIFGKDKEQLISLKLKD
jgi:hypothetical protein